HVAVRPASDECPHPTVPTHDVPDRIVPRKVEAASCIEIPIVLGQGCNDHVFPKQAVGSERRPLVTVPRSDVLRRRCSSGLEPATRNQDVAARFQGKNTPWSWPAQAETQREPRVSVPLKNAGARVRLRNTTRNEAVLVDGEAARAIGELDARAKRFPP